MIHTYTMHNGTVVLAKEYKGDIVPVKYTNRTQALRAAEKLGPEWCGYRNPFYRPFYVALTHTIGV